MIPFYFYDGDGKGQITKLLGISVLCDDFALSVVLTNEVDGLCLLLSEDWCVVDSKLMFNLSVDFNLL